MSTFVSKRGEWYPAKERVGLVNRGDKEIELEDGRKVAPGDPFIYEGGDRAAIQLLQDQGVEHLGQDFFNDPEWRQSIRNKGFEDPDDFLKMIGYNQEEDEKNFKATAAVINKHELPKGTKEILQMGGGRDHSGNRQDTIGGFGEQRTRSPQEVKGK